ncbi:MAG: hypothetical protein AAGI01_02165 [Myxococcota bacterium]
MRQLRNFLSLLSLSLAALAGCGEHVESLGASSVRVRWRLAPHGCTGAGVDEVQVALRPTTPGGRPATARFACAAGAGDVGDVVPGRYDVEVFASLSGRAEWVARIDGLVARPDRVEETGELVLSASPGAVEVVWRFGNGALCGTNGVHAVRALVFDAEDTLHGQHSVSCEEGRLSIEDIPPGDAVILALGEDEDGEVRFEGLGGAAIERGRTARVEIELSDP